MEQDDVIDLIMQLQYFLVRSNEEMLDLFHEAYNKLSDALLDKKATDALYIATVSSKEFQEALDKEFEKEKERNSGALEYACYHSRFL